MDGIFVGNYVGETSFAAINLAMPYVIVLFAFGDLIGVGSAVPISIALGEGRDDDANNIFTCSCIMNVVMGALMGLTLWIGAPFIMKAMGAEGMLAADATTYLRVYAAFAPLTTIGYALDNYLRISGRIRRSLFANTFMAVFGAIVEFILLALVGLRVGAAALSYCLAMLSAALIALWPFLSGKLQLRFVQPRPSWAMLREVFYCGISTFLDNVASRIAAIVLNVVLLAMGGQDAVSIYGILMFCDIIIVLLYGTVDALQPAVGYNWGAGNYGRVKALEYWCFGSTAVLSLIFMVLVVTWPEPIVRIFVADTTSGFLNEAAYALRLFALTYTIRWFVLSAQLFLTAVGEVGPATRISLASALIFPLLCVWLLSPLGLTGLWLNLPATEALSSVLSAWELLRFRARVRKRTTAST